MAAAGGVGLSVDWRMRVIGAGWSGIGVCSVVGAVILYFKGGNTAASAVTLGVGTACLSIEVPLFFGDKRSWGWTVLLSAFLLPASIYALFVVFSLSRNLGTLLTEPRFWASSLCMVFSGFSLSVAVDGMKAEDAARMATVQHAHPADSAPDKVDSG